MVATTDILVSEKLKALAPDLTKAYPRSPRATIGGYVLAARMLDKCRATLNGTNGEYHFNCPLDNIFLGFAGINAEELKNFVATGATDEEVGSWIQTHAKQKERAEVVVWNNSLRNKMVKDLEPGMQVFMEEYVAENLPKDSIIYVWFDIYDIEEKRL